MSLEAFWVGSNSERLLLPQGFVDDEVVQSVIGKTLESIQEVRLAGSERPLNLEGLMQAVAERLADKAAAANEGPSVEEGWQQLLEQGLRSKLLLLNSKEFKSTTEAASLLGIKEPAVRRRISTSKLLALRMPGDGDYRVPAWALDSGLGGEATAALLEASGDGQDLWDLYYFMSTPNGSLNGLRPFECLMAADSLPRKTLADRGELLEYLKLRARSSLLGAVVAAWRSEQSERGGA